MHRRIVLKGLVLSIAVSGLASAAVPSGITHIAIRGPNNPTEIKFEVGGWSFAIGVALGGAVGGALTAMASQKDQMPPLQDFRLGDEINTAIAKALAEDGYLIDSDTGAPDAILSLSLVECKYVRRVWGLIGPRITMDTELRDRATGKRLFSRSYKYDMHTLGLTGDLKPEDQYGFNTIEDVRAHPEVVTAGLRAAIPMIAEDLKAALVRR